MNIDYTNGFILFLSLAEQDGDPRVGQTQVLSHPELSLRDPLTLLAEGPFTYLPTVLT